MTRDAAGDSGFKPVLGLSDGDEPAVRPDWRAWAGNTGQGTVPGTVFDQPEPETLMELTVIVPARNEEDCLGACLESLVGQSEEIFKLGMDWELVVVDDHSRDRTKEIAGEIANSYKGVTLMEAGVEVTVSSLAKGWGVALDPVGADVTAELVLHFGAFLGGTPLGVGG